MGNPNTLEIISDSCKDNDKIKYKKYQKIYFLAKRRIKVEPRVPKCRLNNGIEIPCFGIRPTTTKTESDEVIRDVKEAIDLGYRYFDCACKHGNEEDVGKGIKDKIEEGVIEREEVFVASKLDTSHNAELIEAECRQSLINLGLNYIDLFLIDVPSTSENGSVHLDANENVIKTVFDIYNLWKAMEQLVYKGLVKSIGVSRCSKEQLIKILDRCTILPAVNELEIDPYFSDNNLVKFCLRYGIHVIANTPLQVLEVPIEENTPTLLDDPILSEIAQRYMRTVEQIIYRWIIQRGYILPKFVCKGDIETNIFNFHIGNEDMDMIFSLNRQQKLIRNF